MKSFSDVETDLIGEKVFWKDHAPVASDHCKGIIRGVAVTEMGIKLIIEITSMIERTWVMLGDDILKDKTPPSRTLVVRLCTTVSLGEPKEDYEQILRHHGS